MSFPHILRLPLAAIVLLAACQTKLPPPPANFDDRFGSADVNLDGKVNQEELADFMAYHLFYQRDANRDEVMTPDEWWPGADKRERALFDKRDTNHNSKVSLKEARLYARKDPATAQAIQMADKDRDGLASWKEINAYLGLR